MAKLSKSALHYRKNRASRLKKAKYDTEYHKSPERKKYRAALNKARRKRKLKGDPRDLSHTSSNKLVLENKSTNRGRQGSGGGTTKKRD